MSSTSRASTGTIEGFTEPGDSHVVDVLKTTYLKDKVAFRARLYGLTLDCERDGMTIAMLDPIVNFFTRIFQWIGRGIGFVIGVILWPFLWAGRWYTQRGWILKAVRRPGAARADRPLRQFLLRHPVVEQLQPELCRHLQLRGRATSRPASRSRRTPAPSTAKTCGRSGIADVAADLTDFNVNQNAWISSMILYKLGLFGIDWDNTPLMDNKASFQRGINQAVRRTATELADNLGRVRTTSQIDPDLQDARGNLQFDEETWYFGLNPFGPKTPTPSYYRDAVNKLRAFNDRLQTCQAVFDARADNLKQYHRPHRQRHRLDLGDPQGARREPQQRLVRHPRRRPLLVRLWPALCLLRPDEGARRPISRTSSRKSTCENLWDTMDAAVRLGAAASSRSSSPMAARTAGCMPTHLTTMGFYILRVRSNMVEISNVLTQ